MKTSRLHGKQIEMANQWRQRHGYVDHGGVIVLFRGKVQGWVDLLRNPEHWQPGCVAIDEAGNRWMAIAGNERQGALIWLPDTPMTNL